jgi:hypothetical protein
MEICPFGDHVVEVTEAEVEETVAMAVIVGEEETAAVENVVVVVVVVVAGDVSLNSLQGKSKCLASRKE